MRRPTAAVGSALFFLLAPGVVVGLIPWLLTRWQARAPLPYYWGPVRVIGVILLLAGLVGGPACVPGTPASATNQAHGDARADERHSMFVFP